MFSQDAHFIQISHVISPLTTGGHRLRAPMADLKHLDRKEEIQTTQSALS